MERPEVDRRLVEHRGYLLAAVYDVDPHSQHAVCRGGHRSATPCTHAANTATCPYLETGEKNGADAHRVGVSPRFPVLACYLEGRERCRAGHQAKKCAVDGPAWQLPQLLGRTLGVRQLFCRLRHPTTEEYTDVLGSLFHIQPPISYTPKLGDSPPRVQALRHPLPLAGVIAAVETNGLPREQYDCLARTAVTQSPPGHILVRDGEIAFMSLFHYLALAGVESGSGDFGHWARLDSDKLVRVLPRYQYATPPVTYQPATLSALLSALGLITDPDTTKPTARFWRMLLWLDYQRQHLASKYPPFKSLRRQADAVKATAKAIAEVLESKFIEQAWPNGLRWVLDPSERGFDWGSVRADFARLEGEDDLQSLVTWYLTVYAAVESYDAVDADTPAVVQLVEMVKEAVETTARTQGFEAVQKAVGDLARVVSLDIECIGRRNADWTSPPPDHNLLVLVLSSPGHALALDSLEDDVDHPASIAFVNIEGPCLPESDLMRRTLVGPVAAIVDGIVAAGFARSIGDAWKSGRLDGFADIRAHEWHEIRMAQKPWGSGKSAEHYVHLSNGIPGETTITRRPDGQLTIPDSVSFLDRRVGWADTLKQWLNLVGYGHDAATGRAWRTHRRSSRVPEGLYAISSPLPDLLALVDDVHGTRDYGVPADTAPLPCLLQLAAAEWGERESAQFKMDSNGVVASELEHPTLWFNACALKRAVDCLLFIDNVEGKTVRPEMSITYEERKTVPRGAIIQIRETWSRVFNEEFPLSSPEERPDRRGRLGDNIASFLRYAACAGVKILRYWGRDPRGAIKVKILTRKGDSRLLPDPRLGVQDWKAELDVWAKVGWGNVWEVAPCETHGCVLGPTCICEVCPVPETDTKWSTGFCLVLAAKGVPVHGVVPSDPRWIVDPEPWTSTSQRQDER